MSYPVLSDAIETLKTWSVRLNKMSQDLVASIADFAALYSPLEWGAWDANPTGTGSMTYTPNATFTYGKYFRLRDTIFIQYSSLGTVGGTVNPSLRFELPFPADVTSYLPVINAWSSIGTVNSGVCYINSDNTTATVRRYNAASWTAGANRGYSVAGFYRRKT